MESKELRDKFLKQISDLPEAEFRELFVDITIGELEIIRLLLAVIASTSIKQKRKRGKNIQKRWREKKGKRPITMKR